MRPNFQMENTLHPDVAKEVCTPYNTLGRFFPGYLLKHVPIFRLSNDLKSKQLEYVRQNSNKLYINVKTARWVGSADRHLVENSNGPSRAGETRG